MPCLCDHKQTECRLCKESRQARESRAVQEEAGFSISAAGYPKTACMVPDGAGLPAHPTGPQRSNWRRINYCIFCCRCTFRTILSMGFPELEQHDVLIPKTPAINQHAQQAFAPGPSSRAGPMPAPWPGIQHCKLSLHTSNILFV